MKYLLLTLLTFNVYAVTWKIMDPCKNVAKDSGVISLSKEINTVAKMTTKIFETNPIDFIGVDGYINSIYGTPTGLEAFEIVNEKEVRAYGWCFSLNGESLDVYADQVSIQNEDDVLVWYYGYATKKDGNWITQCMPSYLSVPKLYC